MKIGSLQIRLGTLFRIALLGAFLAALAHIPSGSESGGDVEATPAVAAVGTP